MGGETHNFLAALLRIILALSAFDYVDYHIPSAFPVSGIPMIHFLYSTLEDLTFSECESRSGVKARQIATQPCRPVLDKLS